MVSKAIEISNSGLNDQSWKNNWDETIAKEGMNRDVRSIIKKIQAKEGSIVNFLEIKKEMKEKESNSIVNRIHILAVKQKQLMRQISYILHDLDAQKDELDVFTICFVDLNNKELLTSKLVNLNSSLKDKTNWTKEILEIMNPVAVKLAKAIYKDEEPPNSFFLATAFWEHFTSNKILLQTTELINLISRLNIIDDKMRNLEQSLNFKLTDPNPYYKFCQSEFYLSAFPWLGEFTYASNLLSDNILTIFNEVIYYFDSQHNDDE